MKVKYLGETAPLSLTKNKVYEVLSKEGGFIRIIDDSGEDYLYDPDSFEVVED